MAAVHKLKGSSVNSCGHDAGTVVLVRRAWASRCLTMRLILLWATAVVSPSQSSWSWPQVLHVVIHLAAAAVPASVLAWPMRAWRSLGYAHFAMTAAGALSIIARTAATLTGPACVTSMEPAAFSAAGPNITSTITAADITRLSCQPTASVNLKAEFFLHGVMLVMQQDAIATLLAQLVSLALTVAPLHAAAVVLRSRTQIYLTVDMTNQGVFYVLCGIVLLGVHDFLSNLGGCSGFAPRWDDPVVTLFPPASSDTDGRSAAASSASLQALSAHGGHRSAAATAGAVAGLYRVNSGADKGHAAAFPGGGGGGGGGGSTASPMAALRLHLSRPDVAYFIGLHLLALPVIAFYLLDNHRLRREGIITWAHWPCMLFPCLNFVAVCGRVATAVFDHPSWRSTKLNSMAWYSMMLVRASIALLQPYEPRPNGLWRCFAFFLVMAMCTSHNMREFYTRSAVASALYSVLQVVMMGKLLQHQPVLESQNLFQFALRAATAGIGSGSRAAATIGGGATSAAAAAAAAGMQPGGSGGPAAAAAAAVSRVFGNSIFARALMIPEFPLTALLACSVFALLPRTKLIDVSTGEAQDADTATADGGPSSDKDTSHHSVASQGSSSCREAAHSSPPPEEDVDVLGSSSYSSTFSGLSSNNRGPYVSICRAGSGSEPLDAVHTSTLPGTMLQRIVATLVGGGSSAAAAAGPTSGPAAASSSKQGTHGGHHHHHHGSSSSNSSELTQGGNMCVLACLVAWFTLASGCCGGGRAVLQHTDTDTWALNSGSPWQGFVTESIHRMTVGWFGPGAEGLPALTTMHMACLLGAAFALLLPSLLLLFTTKKQDTASGADTSSQEQEEVKEEAAAVTVVGAQPAHEHMQLAVDGSSAPAQQLATSGIASFLHRVSQQEYIDLTHTASTAHATGSQHRSDSIDAVHMHAGGVGATARTAQLQGVAACTAQHAQGLLPPAGPPSATSQSSTSDSATQSADDASTASPTAGNGTAAKTGKAAWAGVRSLSTPSALVAAATQQTRALVHACGRALLKAEVAVQALQDGLAARPRLALAVQLGSFAVVSAVYLAPLVCDCMW